MTQPKDDPRFREVEDIATFTLAFPIVFGCMLLATIAALPVVLGAASEPWIDLSPLRSR